MLKHLKFLPLLFAATLAHATGNNGWVFGNGTSATAAFAAGPIASVMQQANSGLGTGVGAAALNSTNGDNGFVVLTSSGTLPIGLSTTIYGTNVAAAIVNPLNNASGLLGYSIIGTSGATVPLLNTNDTFSGNNTYSGNSIFSGTVTLPSGTAATNLGYNPANVANNLSDLASASTARTNLGLGGLATVVPGTGVATAAAINVGTSGAFITNGGALGTPSSGNLVNANGLLISGTSGWGTGVATALANATNGSGGLLTFSLIGTSGATIPLLNANNTYSGTALFSSRIKLADQGSCTMTSGACSAQSLATTYGTAPICIATWTGAGTLGGTIKITSNATTVTPSSSNGADTAVVNWVCYGN